MQDESSKRFSSDLRYTDIVLGQQGNNGNDTSNTLSLGNHQEVVRQFNSNSQNRYQQKQQNISSEERMGKIDELDVVLERPKFVGQFQAGVENMERNQKEWELVGENKQKRKQGRQTKQKGRKNKSMDERRKRQINIDMDIDMNQVAEWCEKGTKITKQDDDNFEEDSTGKHQIALQTDQHREQKNTIKRKIEQKIIKYENTGSYGSNGTKNTLNSLRNKVKQLQAANEKKQIEKKEQEIKKYEEEHSINLSSNSRQEILFKNQMKKEEQSQEDPWEKINQQTLQKMEKQKQDLKDIEKMDINIYYQNIILPDDENIDDQSQQQNTFLESLCDCLRGKKRKLNDVAIQVLKLSKVQLSNAPEEIELLRGIWSRLTDKSYERHTRYGVHWNQIGFQGRDPGTDLRSTGILSLIQWYNFIEDNEEYSRKLVGFCVETDIPLALTHIKITSLVCLGIKKFLVVGKKWGEFQEWYNALVYYTFQYIKENAKNIDQVGELVENAVERTKGSLQSAKNKYLKEIKQKK